MGEINEQYNKIIELIASGSVAEAIRLAIGFCKNFGDKQGENSKESIFISSRYYRVKKFYEKNEISWETLNIEVEKQTRQLFNLATDVRENYSNDN